MTPGQKDRNTLTFLAVAGSPSAKSRVLDRDLSLGMCLHICAGIIPANPMPGFFGVLERPEQAFFNLVAATLIPAMDYPMMVMVDFSILQWIGEGRKYRFKSISGDGSRRVWSFAE